MTRADLVHRSYAGLGDSGEGMGWDRWWPFMLFQVPAVLLWGQSVQSPGCCSGWILQTANRCKCVLFTDFLPVCLSVDTFIHSHTREPASTVLPGWVLSHHRRACFPVFQLLSPSQLRKFSENDTVESKAIWGLPSNKWLLIFFLFRPIPCTQSASSLLQ